MHTVYKYVYNKEIIYIGKSDIGVYERIAQHGCPGDNIPEEAWPELKKSDIFYFELPNHVMADIVESELIRRHKPKWNRSKKRSDWKGLPFPELEWTLYRPLPKGVKDPSMWDWKLHDLYDNWRKHLDTESEQQCLNELQEYVDIEYTPAFKQAFPQFYD